MKRSIDFTLSLLAIIIFSPIVIIFAILIWMEDGKWPFYTPLRVGKSGKIFRIYKLRSMVVNADANKVDTTTDDDLRITKIGKKIRNFKIDELPQFVNVVFGQMSLVGPRPNIDREVSLYSEEEKRMLNVRPGITDISSIVFSDLGLILFEAQDPNLAYNQLVRPWKSRLALFYIENRNLVMDIQILWLTLVTIIKPEYARKKIIAILEKYGASLALIKTVRRDEKLVPVPPPGLDKIVSSRKI